jgi:hypothetical protein
MLSPSQAFLERWWNETRDPSPQRRVWKQRHALAGVLAYERIGLLSAEQAARWRQRLTDPRDEAIDAGSKLGADARAAGERYLGELVARLTPMRREPGPDAVRLEAEVHAAIETLHAVGVLDQYARASWREASGRKLAPWQTEPLAPPVGEFEHVAVRVPSETDAQAAEDAAFEAEWAAMPKAENVRRVIAGGPQRQNDLAVIALVVHEDATSLHFHYLGQPQRERDDEQLLESFERITDRLAPPVLKDDQGHTYEPALAHPASASGAGGIPDPERREAITGYWLYTPSAPDIARNFSVSQNGASWTLQER